MKQLLLREGVRLVTLTGAGGSGKTRVGLQVATDLIDEFPGGVYFVALAPITDPGPSLQRSRRFLESGTRAASPWPRLCRTIYGSWYTHRRCSSSTTSSTCSMQLRW